MATTAAGRGADQAAVDALGRLITVVDVLEALISGERPLQDALGTVSAATDYETVAAGQSDQVLGTTGGAGDHLSHLLVVVATAATAQVQIKDGSGSAITVFPNSPGGGIGTYEVRLGADSVNGAWKVTTGAGVSVMAFGIFA